MLTFIGGLFAGGIIGIGIMALCNAAGNADDADEVRNPCAGCEYERFKPREMCQYCANDKEDKFDG